MNIADTLRASMATVIAFAAKIVEWAKEPAMTFAGLVTLGFGASMAAGGHLWVSAGLTAIGIIALATARDALVERARYEAFKEGILILLNNNGANITVTYHDGGATISIPKGDAQ